VLPVGEAKDRTTELLEKSFKKTLCVSDAQLNRCDLQFSFASIVQL